jgi:hypothetical protein
VTLSPALRKIALTGHVTFSVGWLGAVATFLVLAVAALTSQEAQQVRASYVAMELTGWYVLVPFCLASLLTGIGMSLGTTWGLFHHYWVLVKLLITVASALILLLYTQTLAHLGHLAADMTLPLDELRDPSPVLHSAAALTALLVTTTLSVYKPRGLTPYGWYKQQQQRSLPPRPDAL